MMRALLLATAVLLPSAVGAQPSLSLRLGYAQSLGSAAGDLPMSQVVVGQVPVQADLLWRFGASQARPGRGFAAGGYVSYGVGLAGGCDRGASCGASSWRLGVEGTWTFGPPSSFDGWVGGGVGYEWTTRRRSFAGSEVKWEYRGTEMLSLQGGAHLLRVGRVRIGPFLLLALGRYSDLGLETGPDFADRPISGKRLHAWLEVGVRAKLDL